MGIRRPPPVVTSHPRVGDYRLLAKIGEGGMGVVHLAQSPDGRRVALKVLRPHIIGDDEARERLSREVSSLRLITSPRIAEVVDADPWGETPYVATRYVPGLSLHEHVRTEGPIAGADLVHFAGGLAEALQAVHRVGVLHRDVKPSNVLLEGRNPVLIDFGLARLAEDPRMTQTGWLLGTPGYLAPEILYGEDATPASDVHAWAATVAFAAAGRPPFGRGPAVAIMDRVRRGEHDLAGVPEGLLGLVTACLAPVALDRPTLHEVRVELDRSAPGTNGAHHHAGETDGWTMPMALATGTDPDATDVIAPDHGVGATTPLTAATTPLRTTTAPTTAPGSVPRPTAVYQPAARAPYAEPPPPRVDPGQDRWARAQRGLLLTVLGAAVAAGFAWAPYVAILGLAAATLVLRTVSWTTESSRNRRMLRGRARWFDRPVALATAPWYLLVASGGTLLLLLWATALAFLVGLALLLVRMPAQAGLLVMGAVLALSLWFGPGARRVRVPMRGLTRGLTRSPTIGWTALALGFAGLGLLGYLGLTGGVVWDPQPGPPWREGTILGDIAGGF